jgi:non-specific serine/threonine protein kinase/serine/threonine-protein kinase
MRVSNQPTLLLPTEAASGLARFEPAGPLSGRLIAGYRIQRLIGHGGMGTVYEALQDHPRRRVAFKVLIPGLVQPALLRRFQREAEALGRLQHPGIAQIYEAGSFDSGDGPQPFFAMEFVDGRPLTAHADECRLSRADRLRLIIRICEALQHAHQRGVIHRDLKPANILVQAEAAGPGWPKILDFGIARVLDESSNQPLTSHTGFGQILGTLSYMSPEQARGEAETVDFRSDVYALGVITYELISGRLPFELSGLPMHEAVRTLCEDEPPRLSTIDPSLRGDLEIIVATALAKEAHRRYASARDLAADIEAFLDNRPIAARPPTQLYRLGKFVRRNKAVVAGVAGLIVSLTAGLITATALYLRAEHHRSEAERQAAQLEQVARLQETRLAQLAIERMGEQLRSDLLVRLDEAAGRSAGAAESYRQYRPMLADLLADTDFPGLAFSAVDQHLLLPTLADIDRDLADQPLVQARLLQSLASTYSELGRHARAEPLQRRALALRERWLGPEHPLTLSSGTKLVALLDRLGRFAEAEHLARTVLARRTIVSGPKDPDTLRIQQALGGVLLNQGKVEEAITLLRAVHADFAAVLGPRHRDSLNALNSLAMAEAQAEAYERAQTMLEQALAGYRESFGDDDPGTMRALNNLGYIHDLQERYAEAEALYRAALQARQRVFGAEHPETLTAMNNLAFALSGLGREAEAEPLYRQAMEGRRRVLGDQHPDTIAAMSNYCVVLRESGRHAEAEQLAATVVASARRALPEGHWHLGVFLGHHGMALLALGRYAEAEERLLESERILAAALGRSHSRYADAVDRLVQLYTRWSAEGVAEARGKLEHWQARKSE